jgi:hypothetical protein
MGISGSRQIHDTMGLGLFFLLMIIFHFKNFMFHFLTNITKKRILGPVLCFQAHIFPLAACGLASLDSHASVVVGVHIQNQYQNDIILSST